MATIKAVSSKCSVNGAIAYVTQEEKTEEKLVSGINCSPATAAEEMQTTKEMWGKSGGRTYKHYVQSFHEDEKITPEQAHELAKKFVEACPQFRGFEVLIATHQDRSHIHTHIIVNSVSLENGHKFRQSKAELQQMKDLSDRICLEHGLSVCEKGKTFYGEVREETAAYTKESYQLLKKAERGEAWSYVQDIALAVLEVREQATSREDFAEKLRAQGVGVEWTDSRKYITFTDLARQEAGERCKVRNSKLAQHYGGLGFEKGDFEREFTANLRKQQNIERGREQLAKPLPGAEPGTPGKSAAAFLGELAATRRASENKLSSKLEKCTNRTAFKQARTTARLAAGLSAEIAQAMQNLTEQAIEDRERI